MTEQNTTYGKRPRGRPPGKPIPLRDRFWRLVDKRSPSECWDWTGSPLGEGYGGFMMYKLGCIYAHRVAYELECGPIPDGLFVCHKCDNRRCCNPEHFFLGTHQDNMTDMKSKGRARNQWNAPGRLR